MTAIIAIASSEPTGKQAELNLKLPNDRIKCTSSTRLCEIPNSKIGLGSARRE